MKYAVTLDLELSNEEASFIQSMARNPSYFNTVKGYGGQAVVRKALVIKGLVATSRRLVINGGGEKYTHGELSDLGRAAVAAIQAQVAKIEI